MDASFFLRLYEYCLSSIILGSDGEVNPIAALFVSLDEKFIVIALRAIRDVE